MNNELKEAILKLKEVKQLLEEFSNREEAIDYLVKETGLSIDECTGAYDILIHCKFDN